MIRNGDRRMENRLNDEMIEHIGILAKLELSGEERERAKEDMGKMLGYIDKMGELDTSGIEPLSHASGMQNVFREDEAANGDMREDVLRNAPEEKDGMFLVPRTFEG